MITDVNVPMTSATIIQIDWVLEEKFGRNLFLNMTSLQMNYETKIKLSKILIINVAWYASKSTILDNPAHSGVQMIFSSKWDFLDIITIHMMRATGKNRLETCFNHNLSREHVREEISSNPNPPSGEKLWNSFLDVWKHQIECSRYPLPFEIIQNSFRS